MFPQGISYGDPALVRTVLQVAFTKTVPEFPVSLFESKDSDLL